MGKNVYVPPIPLYTEKRIDPNGFADTSAGYGWNPGAPITRAENLQPKAIIIDRHDTITGYLIALIRWAITVVQSRS